MYSKKSIELKPKVERMVISDLVTYKEVNFPSIHADNWCSCIDGALTKENYIKNMQEIGFTNIEILDGKTCLEVDPR